MNAATLRQGIAFAAANAAASEPTDIDQRARCFVAGLAGWLEDDEAVLYGEVQSLLGDRDARGVTVQDAGRAA